MIFNTWYYPNLMGGAEHSVLLLAENLVKRNINVAVVTVDSDVSGIMKETINGVEIYRLDGKKYDVRGAYFNKYRTKYKKIKDKFYELYNFQLQKDINKVIREFKPDIAHVNCFSGLSYCLFNTLKKNKIKTIYTARNYFVIYPADKSKINNYYIDKIATKIYKYISNFFMKSIDALVAPSNYTLSELKKEGMFLNCNLQCCIQNSIDVDIELTDKIISEKKHIDKNIFEFLYVGWLSEEKGILILLEAFKILSNKYNNVVLKICGDGKLKDLVLKEERENSFIKYLGKLPPEELKKVYIQSDVLIVPSIWAEPFGRVVIEGNSFGLPVIGANSGGISEIIGNIGGGVTYNANDVHDLMKNIIKFLDRNMIKSFYDNILSNIDLYDISHQIDSYCELYYRILEKY